MLFVVIRKMNVQVGEAGHQVFAAPVNLQRARGGFDFIRRPHLDNLPVLHNHRLISKDLLPIHRRDIDINERDGLAFVVSRRLLRPRGAARADLRASLFI
jgi:hypothetical protein